MTLWSGRTSQLETEALDELIGLSLGCVNRLSLQVVLLPAGRGIGLEDQTVTCAGAVDLTVQPSPHTPARLRVDEDALLTQLGIGGADIHLLSEVRDSGPMT